MMVQIFFSENISPTFTEEDKDFYRPLVSNQLFPIGNQVNGRQLIRTLINESNIVILCEFLTTKCKDPHILSVRNPDGTSFEDTNGEKKYMEDMDTYNQFFQPDEYGYTPPTNTVAGWATVE